MSKQNKKIEKDVDPRFAKVFSDPKFTNIPKNIQKVQINDDRFEKMFSDKSFHDKLDYDEYGNFISKVLYLIL